jgi:hypothetical protein
MLDSQGSMPDDSEVIAEWPDGHTHSLPGWTWRRMRDAMESSVRRGVGVGDLAVLQHKANNHTISIRQKVDRHLLLAAYEQKKMIFSVKVNLWGKVEDERQQVLPAHPACQGALAFAKKVLEQYCNGEVDKKGINTLKNTMLKAEGLHKSERKACMKRPASSLSATAAKPEPKVKREAPPQPLPPPAAVDKKKPDISDTELGEGEEGEEEEREHDSEEECAPDDWDMPAMPATLHEQMCRFFS